MISIQLTDVAIKFSKMLNCTAMSGLMINNNTNNK